MQDDNPLPFNEVKPSIQRLVSKQQAFCNTIVAEAKAVLEDENSESEAHRCDRKALPSEAWDAKKQAIPPSQ